MKVFSRDLIKLERLGKPRILSGLFLEGYSIGNMNLIRVQLNQFPGYNVVFGDKFHLIVGFLEKGYIKVGQVF